MAKSKIQNIFNKDRVNKWLNNTDGVDEKVVQMSNEATIYHEQVLRMIGALQKQVKECSEGPKHPFAKSAKGVKGYREGIVTKSIGPKFDKASEALDKMVEANNEFSKKVANTILAKCLSFKEVDCRDIDQQMKQLAKVIKELESNKKKAEKDNNNNYLVEASQESLKKCSEETLNTLTKYNKAAVELVNMTSTEYKKIFEAYNEEGAKIMKI